MNQQYKLIHLRALKLVEINEDVYLIDSGSPFSFFLKGKLEIDGKEYKNSGFVKLIGKRMQQLSLYLNEDLKKEISGLIGSDILLQTGLFIDMKESIVEFNSKDILNSSSFLFEIKEIKNQKYISFPSLFVTGMREEGYHPFLLDTGACVSIFKKDLCSHAQYAYRQDYYYPALGGMVTADFVFFKIEKESIINIVAGANWDDIIDDQFEFLEVDGELSFNDFEYHQFSINSNRKKIEWV